MKGNGSGTKMEQETSSENFRLVVIGDSLVDTYLLGNYMNNRFKVTTRMSYPGGANNTYANFQAIAQNKPYWAHISTNIERLELVRFIQDDVKIFESYLGPTSEFCCSPVRPWYTTYKGIIVSDYNKGTANRELQARLESDFIIVDSRYRSTHPNLIKAGKVKIWRCTQDEFDALWARQFDFIIVTSSKEVSIYSYDKSTFLHKAFSFEVPSIEVVDDCGAGDTFVAALGAQLLFAKEINLDSIKEAIPFCIQAAQDVCMKSYTAITDLVLI